MRIHQSRRHRRARVRAGTGCVFIGACTRVAWLVVFASYRAVIQEIETCLERIVGEILVLE